jgi:hypothetical protein
VPLDAQVEQGCELSECNELIMHQSLEFCSLRVWTSHLFLLASSWKLVMIKDYHISTCLYMEHAWWDLWAFGHDGGSTEGGLERIARDRTAIHREAGMGGAIVGCSLPGP